MTPSNFQALTNHLRYTRANGEVTFKNKAYRREYWESRQLAHVYDDLIASTAFLPASTSVSVRYYFVEHNITAIPACVHCNQPINVPKTYGECLPTLHARCVRPHTDHKIRQTNQDRYGGNPAQHVDVRQKISSAKTTEMLARATEKSLATKRMKIPGYGDKASAKRERAAIAHQMSSRGYRHASQYHIPPDVLAQIDDPSWLRAEYSTKPANQIAAEQGVNKTIIQNRLRAFGIDTVHRTVSLAESEIVAFIQSISSTPIVQNSRGVGGMDFELDIYMPDIKLAIEYHGQFWHVESKTPRKNIHRYKYAECAKRGITLLQVWSSEWKHKRSIVESRIRHKLGTNVQRIGARSCVVCPISPRDSRQAVTAWHMQGPAAASVHLGLFYENALVGVMTFAASRYTQTHQWELVRFCTQPGMVVSGGAGKLFSHFIRTYQPASIISYSNNRYGNGAVYAALGMVALTSTPPGYYYVDLSDADAEPTHRSAFQKHKLSGILPSYDPSLTEYQNMLNNGYDRIWDAGNKVFSWTK